jgi:copper chaperone
MSRAILSVPDISCEHCENTITNALSGQPGVTAVAVDVPAKQVQLDFDESKLTLDRVKEILQEEDYPVESVVQQA